MREELLRFATSPAGGVFAVVLGLLWGSFANVCIYRWPPTDEHPNGRSVVSPPSHCPACKAPIRWYDNVPILAYLWLRGRCRACKTKFSPRYLLVEALTGALFGVAWWFTLGDGGLLSGSEALRALRFAIDAAFVWLMIVITFIDIDTMYIFDELTLYSGLPLAYGASLLLPDHRWWEGLLGAGIGYGVPWSLRALYKLIRGREGMGLGDAKLLAVVGALMGWRAVVASLFIGSTVGSVIELPRQIARRRAKPSDGADSVLTTEIPFGPWLAIGAVFYLFAEPWLALRFRI